MAHATFDAKSFNPEAFRYKVDTVPNLHMNELKKSAALASNPDIRDMFGVQGGAGYARLAMRGQIDGEAVNYDGRTDIPATSTRTMEQGVVVVGRAKAWVEKDFSYDITGGVDFMDHIARQIAEYKDGLDQKTLLAVLKGIFLMKGTANEEFVRQHTTVVNGPMTAVALNQATQRACGAYKKHFALVFLHSDVSTTLENMNLMERLKYTDPDGIQRSLEMGTWNGKLVVVDDDMPVDFGYFLSSADAEGACQVISDEAEAAAGKIRISDVKPYFDDAALTVGAYVTKGARYTTYVLGKGAIAYEDIGVKSEYEMDRNPAANGGEDTLYTRQRKCFAPFGISYEKKVQATLSPTDEELANGDNWTLVHSGEPEEKDRQYLDHRTITIARILSRG